MSTSAIGLPVGVEEVHGRGRLRAYFWSDNQRAVQTVLGLMWLLDGGLQFQSYMYSKGFLQDLAASGSLRHYVVVGLGTNGPVTAGQIRELRRLIGPHRELVLINTFGPMPWESEVNTVLGGAARHDARVDLADWHQAIAHRTGLLWPDGIHPRPSGAKVYARVVLAAVRAELPAAPAPACSEPTSVPTGMVRSN